MSLRTWFGASVVGVVIACASVADGAERTYFIEFSGGLEVPGPGDPDGSAAGTLTVNDVTGVVAWDFTYEDISAPTLMHIHGPGGGVGESAGVFINLGVVTSGGAGTLVDSLVHGDLGELTQIIDAPHEFYVNIHNGDFGPGAVRGQLSLVVPGVIKVSLESVATGLTSPVAATHAGDGSGRLFVVDQAGQIRIIDANGALLPDPFVDITDVMVPLGPGFDERGLLGLAFHPDYASNGRFFVRYSADRPDDPADRCDGTPRGCHKEVLAEYSVSADPNIANQVGTVLFEVDQPEFNHNGGGLAFGPDGLLYFSLGDGGGRYDGLANVPQNHGPMGHGQDIDTPLGAMLRIDVDNGVPYAIPGDNPFAAVAGLDEMYAYGLRNPYRFSFDDGPGGDGRLICADVGQHLFEEVSIIELGGNYGWVHREGFHCLDPFDPFVPPATCTTTGPLGEPLVDPVAEYHHGDGTAIVGGFVYRGSRYPALHGTYVFGDFSTDFNTPDGRLFSLDADGVLSAISTLPIGDADAPLGAFLFGFGEDEDGELYVLTSTNLSPFGNGGEVLRLELACECERDGDFDQVDVADLLNFLGAWFAEEVSADVAAPAGVDIADLLAFLGCWFSAMQGGQSGC